MGGLRLACCPYGRGYRRSADARGQRVHHAVAVEATVLERAFAQGV
jgi:hypothetical protein